MTVENEQGKEALAEKNEEKDTDKEMTTGEGDRKEDEALTADDVKVKIAGGDAKIDMGKDSGFTGMTKEELMKYANDPFWVRLRWFLFILFWIVWLAMLVASVVIIVMAPKCPSPEPRKWYMKGPIYKVNVKDFKDIDGDSLGDLKGLESELDYLVETGVNSVWILDIAEFPIKTDDQSKADFESLAAEMEKRNLKIIVDLKDPSDADFWLDLGVDGFKSVEKSLSSLKSLRTVLDNSTVADTEDIKVLITEAGGNQYGDNIPTTNISPLVHLPLSEVNLASQFSGTAADPAALKINTTITDYLAKLPENAWPNFQLGGSKTAGMVDAMNMLLFLLPGTPFTTYGEEIGLDKPKPMAWTGQGGLNVASQNTTEGNIRSHYKNFQELAKLRHQEAILFGDHSTFTKNNNTVFGLTRVKRGNPGYLLLINLSDKATEVDLIPEEGQKIKNVPSKVRMYLKSVGVDGVETIPEAETKSFESSKTPIEANQAIVFTFVPNFEEE